MKVPGILLGLALAAGLALPVRSAPGLYRPPYVQSVTGTAAGIAFDTTAKGNGWVEFGPTRELGRKTTGAHASRHYLRLQDLEPGSLVYYRVGVGDTPLTEVSRFHTAAAPGAEFSFAAIGDCGAGFGAQRPIAERMQADDPEFVVVTGDVVYERGTQEEYDVKFFPVYRTLLGRAPWWPSLGNHDVRTADGAPYLKNWYLPNNERWYSFDWGDVHFVALDSNAEFGEGTPQDRWLARDLAESQCAWKVVYFHHPPYTNSNHEPSKSVRRAWVPLFEKHGVQLVLNGHNHVYERTKPIRGVTYVVTGGGGASLYRSRPADFLAATESRHHYLRMQASPERLSWQAVDAQGNVFDEASLAR